MLDLSAMRSVHVDPRARTARVEPGATLGDVDRETQAHGLAVPTGINSTTGIAGLTLGGGFGWITRRFGMTIDNLVSADVVTADGRLVRASAEENPDLFWAIRGGGGNFGVVASFEFRLHPVGPEVLSGLIVHPIADARAVLAGFREVCEGAPDELTIWAVMRRAPPLPFLPEAWHGREVLILAACCVGAVARVPEDATALPQHRAHTTTNVHIRWDAPARDEARIARARGLHERTAADAAPGVCIDFVPGGVAEAYGPNLDRTHHAKAPWDPGNLSRANHNIEPAAADRAAE